jgi:hypothetical protein
VALFNGGLESREPKLHGKTNLNEARSRLVLQVGGEIERVGNLLNTPGGKRPTAWG